MSIEKIVVSNARGPSVYSLWLAEGNTGSLTDFFNAMVAELDLTVTGASGQSVSTRALLAAIASPVNRQSAILTEAGREGLFIFSTADLSAKVTADPQQGVYVAPSADTDGSSGAWIRHHDGPVYANWFGAVGGNPTVDAPAFAAAIAYLKSIAVGSGSNKGSTKLLVAGGKVYDLGTTTLEITHTLIIEGEGVGMAGGAPSTLRWAANTTGIRVQRYNTSGAGTVDAVTHTGGDGTIVRGLTLTGAYTNMASEGDFHGIHAKARVTVEDCVIANFQGDGIYINATQGSGTATEGNANGFEINRVRIGGCRDGVKIMGADANGGTGAGIDTAGNRRWGIDDSSFLGNTWVGGQDEQNGLGANITPTVVSNGTYRYYVKDGQAVGASTNAPPAGATSNTWWGFLEAGAANVPLSILTWVSGVTVREGGPYRTTNPNARSLFVGRYAEPGQGPARVAAPSIVIGGLQGAGVIGTGSWLRNNAGLTVTAGGIGSQSLDGSVSTLLASDGTSHLVLVHPTKLPLGTALDWDGNDLAWNYGNSFNTALYPFYITGPNSTNPMGGHKMGLPNGYGLGIGATTMRVTFGTAAPSTGTWTRGSICHNSTPSAGGAPGWVCVTAGTPGTWKAMANLAA